MIATFFKYIPVLQIRPDHFDYTWILPKSPRATHLQPCLYVISLSESFWAYLQVLRSPYCSLDSDYTYFLFWFILLRSHHRQIFFQGVDSITARCWQYYRFFWCLCHCSTNVFLQAVWAKEGIIDEMMKLDNVYMKVLWKLKAPNKCKRWLLL